MIKGCNIFWAKNWQTLAAWWAGALSCNNKKNLDNRTGVECASGGDPILLYKILYLLFFPLVRILCALRLESRKNIINMVFMRDLWNFSLFGRGDVLPPHSELCRFVSGSYAKHQVSCPVVILFKKKILYRASRLMSWQDVT